MKTPRRTQNPWIQMLETPKSHELSEIWRRWEIFGARLLDGAGSVQVNGVGACDDPKRCFSRYFMQLG